MLKFLSKMRIEFNALDPRTAACMEFLAQCNARKAKESNPACQVQVKRRTDDQPPQITVTFVNGVEEKFDATATPAQTIRNMILEKGPYLETEQMFREAGSGGLSLYRRKSSTSHSLVLSRRKQKRRSNDCSQQRRGYYLSSRAESFSCNLNPDLQDRRTGSAGMH